MKKILLSTLVMIIGATVSFSQTTKPKLDEVKNDPKTTQNAAKADVNVTNNKTVVDNAEIKRILVKKREERVSQRKKHQQRRTS